MLVAVRSGSCRDRFGRLLEIEAGATRWSEESEELADPRVAALFAPDPSSGGRLVRTGGTAGISRSHSEPASVTSPTVRSTAALEIPEFRSTRSPVEVVVTRSARETMLDDLFWSTRQDAFESGGFLFSKPTRSWDRSVEVLVATRTGDAQRSSGSLGLDNAMWRSAERAFAIDGLDQPLAGIWHSHPQTRDGEPSDHDLSAWLAVLNWNEAHGRSSAYAVGLIYAASEVRGDTWARPHLHGYVVRRAGHSRRPVCEPADVRERR